MYILDSHSQECGNANLLGVELSYQRDFGFIAPALKCIGFYGTYTYTHSRVEDFNFEGRENEEASVCRVHRHTPPMLRSISRKPD